LPKSYLSLKAKVKLNLTLFDNHNRPLTYVRLAVTDRCNLRCFYCMPQEKVQYLPKKNLLTFEEIERLLLILSGLGVTKVRFTGGEPFVRNDLMSLIRRTSTITGINDIHLTTNGILTAPYIPELKSLGIASINLSLDTLDKKRFFQITQRDEFDKTFQTLQLLQEFEIPVKINAVVMEGKNIDDISPLAELTRNQNIDVRFIEEMPFNGKGMAPSPSVWNYRKILDHLKEQFGDLEKLNDTPHSTSYNYRIPGFKGSVGIIAAYSRTFCGTCNRIRITPQGMLKTCLYDGGALNLRDMIRNGSSDDEIRSELIQAFRHRAKNGFEAEQRTTSPVFESMSSIGG
jgi:molybdenum cofactor biosynthesis protein A